MATGRVTDGTPEDAPSKGPLRLLVILRAANMDRVMEGFLRCALERGHTIHVALEQKKRRMAGSLFEVLEAEYPQRYSFGRLPPRRDRWLHAATKLRCAIDYLPYLEAEFGYAEPLRIRARRRAPWYMKVLAASQLLRVKGLRRAVAAVLRAVERRMPLSDWSLATLREWRPDVVLVSPLVELGSGQGDHLRAADSLGIPTGLLVASWDNLTTKGVIRDAPDVTIVWNEDQVREAAELHGLDADSVIATGAHSHDHWFSFKPSTASDEFGAKVGLEGQRTFLLYACSSGFVSGVEEVAFVAEWSTRLAACDDPVLASLGVLIRPHPYKFDCWRDADVVEPGRIVVWPRGGVAPADPQSKRDYFDSLYHSKAVVGIHTTAMVDSAIVRRPVFTLISERFRDSQMGTVHFSYLAREQTGGLLNIARSWDEHFEQLAGVLHSDNGYRERIDSFLRAFVRPQGLEKPAAPIAIEAIERVATRSKKHIRRGGPLRWLIGVVAVGLGHVHDMREALWPEEARKRWERRKKEKRGRKKERHA